MVAGIWAKNVVICALFRNFFVGYLLQMLILSPHAYASSWQDDLESRLQSQPLAQVYAWLLATSTDGGSQGERQRHLGHMAMELGDPVSAIEHFEQVILLAPLDLGSRLELTIAYADIGNRGAARASLAALRHYAEGQAMPSAAIERIESLEQRLATGYVAQILGVASSVSGSLSVTEGYDSNANLGSSQRTIPLKLWGELPLRLELADESRAQPSSYDQLDGRLSMPLTAMMDASGVADWSAVAGASMRRYHQVDTLDRQDFYLGGQWQPPGSRQQLSVLGVHQRMAELEGRWSLNASYRRLLTPWLLSGLDVQWQQEPHDRNSRRLRTGLWLDLQRAIVWGRVSWQFRPDRSAGDTWRVKLGVDSPAWRWQGVNFHAFAGWEYRQDTEAYSQVFFGDQERSETTVTWGGQGSYPLSESLDGVLSISWERTEAKLALFERRRLQAEARLEWRW